MNIFDKPSRPASWVSEATCSQQDFRTSVGIEATHDHSQLTDEIVRNVPF